MKVEKLLVVAGPRACGKSRLIRSCRQNAALHRNIPGLAQMFNPLPRAIRISQTAMHENTNYPEALVHIDIYTPFEYAPVLPSAALQEWMTVEKFASMQAMQVLREAQEVHAMTLMVPQQKTRERWLDRKSSQDRRQVATNLVRILSDADGRLYEHLYRVWFSFLAMIGPKHHWYIRETDAGYAVGEFRGGENSTGAVGS